MKKAERGCKIRSNNKPKQTCTTRHHRNGHNLDDSTINPRSAWESFIEVDGARKSQIENWPFTNWFLNISSTFYTARKKKLSTILKFRVILKSSEKVSVAYQIIFPTIVICINCIYSIPTFTPFRRFRLHISIIWICALFRRNFRSF